LTLEDKQITTRLLLACGATIQEINALRKHLSRIKGGQLARAASPARLVTLVLSDVIGDPPDVIASGPTVPDPTTFETCRSIIDKYQLASQLSLPVRGVLKSGYEGRLQETPKPHDPLFKRCDYVVVGNNRQALNAAQREARRIGFHPLILSSCMEGETREVAKVHVALAKEVLQSNQPVRRPACLISGGETTVTLRGKGKGGRNQEFALAAALEMEGLDGVLVLSGGTDGSDGSTDAAGAYADGETTERARLLGFDPLHSLNENDAYPLFQALEDLLITGPTRTNVMDIRLVLIP
jgi:hydroxypyruvate reductase